MKGKPNPLAADLAAYLAKMDSASSLGRRYAADFPAFAADRLGASLAGYQTEILANLTGKRRVCVRGPHGLGKSAVASWAVLAFAATREAAGCDWKVVTTAGAWRQLEKYLWPEIRKWAGRAKGVTWREGQEVLTLSLKLKKGEAFAVASDRAELIEGAHADEILYVLDEGKAIPDPTWDAVEGAFSAGEAYVLALSTPGTTAGRFYAIHARRPGLGDWWPRHVTLEEAIAAGRISREWAEARRVQWGETSPVYRNRVLGEFAEEADGIIPLSWIEAAVERWNEWRDAGAELRQRQTAVGCDVGGGTGGDATVLARRYGETVTALEAYARGDEMATAGRVLAALQSGGVAVVDGIGIGAGVVARLKEQGRDVRSFIAGARSEKTDRSGELGFENRRAEAWWGFRERLDPSYGSRVAIPDDDELVGELAAPRWKPTSRGRVLVESKDDIRKRLGRSTDRADAVVMSFATGFDDGDGEEPPFGTVRVYPTTRRGAY